MSLLGRSWVMSLPRSVEGRKLLGSILFPVGLVVAILGGLLPFASYDSFGPEFVLTPVFIVTGFLLAGAGLNLYFGSESSTMNRIRRALQKPLL